LQAAPVLVINATELRTGSAFRFGTIESESWRSGKLHKNDVKVAHAVAASAAFSEFFGLLPLTIRQLRAELPVRRLTILPTRGASKGAVGENLEKRGRPARTIRLSI
jgi:hypothetical protein